MPGLFQILQKKKKRGRVDLCRELCGFSFYKQIWKKKKKEKNKDATINNPIRVDGGEKKKAWIKSLLVKIKAQSLTLPPLVTHFFPRLVSQCSENEITVYPGFVSYLSPLRWVRWDFRISRQSSIPRGVCNMFSLSAKIMCVNKQFVWVKILVVLFQSFSEARECVWVVVVVGGGGAAVSRHPPAALPHSSSSVFEPSMLHSMASGIQIAIKGLSVSSWRSIDLQRESNPDYEVQ